MTALIRRLQESQLSVQGLTRLASVCVFLLASRTDAEHVALVAFQGALLAIPYTLIEALVGRAQAAGVVPAEWNTESWALRAAVTVMAPVWLAGFVALSVALPDTSIIDRLIVMTPVLLQLPLEGLFWAMAKTRSRRSANLIPQVAAVGTLLTAGVLAALDVRLDIAAIPAQVAVLCWALTRIRTTDRKGVRPSYRRSVGVGAAYCAAAGFDLAYVVALPAFAGALAGGATIVVLRAMDLAFGPFHVTLSATTREDIVAGPRARWLTGVRVFTVAVLAGTTAIVLASSEVRRFLADDLAAVGVAAVALYCGYKAALMVCTWLATRHMIQAGSRRFLASAVGSRLIAFGGLAVAIAWVDSAPELFLQLLICEVIVVAWYSLRMRPAASDRITTDAEPAEAVAAVAPDN